MSRICIWKICLNRKRLHNIADVDFDSEMQKRLRNVADVYVIVEIKRRHLRNVADAYGLLFRRQDRRKRPQETPWGGRSIEHRTIANICYNNYGLM